MTDITDIQRREVRAAARTILDKPYDHSAPACELAEFILATVDAPALSEDLARIAENSPVWTIQHVNENLRRTDNYREFKEFLGVQKGAESNAESIDPADVQPGEAWKANIWYEDKRHPGTAIKSSGGDWTVTRDDGSRTTYRMNEYVELVSRLVPAPRVITDAKELLSGFSEGTIIRDKTGDIMVRDYDGWTEVNSDEWFVSLPATVLWEPEN